MRPSTVTQARMVAVYSLGRNETATRPRDAAGMCPRAPRHADVEAALAQARAVFTAALAAGDTEAASLVYAEDARLLPPAAPPLRGRAAIARFWQAGIAAGITAVRLDVSSIEHADGIACETGRYELRLEPGDGAAVLERGSYLFVHARGDDGCWRRTAEMLNPEAAPLRVAPAAEPTRRR
jgi:ketosteroid isomerase-like protein